jgi:SAM-dependent methyltransferase
MSAAEERLGNDPTSELWGEHRSRYRFAAQFVRGANAKRKRVLDVACGAGFGLRMLGEMGVRAVGVDYDAGALSHVRRAQPSARLVNSDGTRLPLHDATFDVVVSFETLDHVPDADSFVGEIRRVLEPDGTLVLSTPNRAFGPPEHHTGNPFHVREFTADELCELLKQSFAHVELYGQRPLDAYRFVPFLMVQPDHSLRAMLWKLQARLPVELRNQLATLMTGRPFYPSEEDYDFTTDSIEDAHALVAVAR